MKLLKLLTMISVSLGLCQFASSQQVLLTNANILDVETGSILKQHDLLIDGNTIAEIGPTGSLLPAATTRTINLYGATLLPGLSDSHVHLTSRADVHGYRRLTVSTPRAAISGVANAEKTLLAGFTTVRNLGAPGFTDIDLKSAIEDGEVPGPRIIGAGHSIGITGGHCDSNLLPFEYQQTGKGVADGPWAVRAKVRENKKYGAEVIKFCGTGGVLSKGTQIGAQQFSLEEMKAIVDEAKLLGLKVAVHAHGMMGINSALEAGVDSVEHASFISDRGIQKAIERGTYLSMDIYVTDYILSEGEAAGILQESLDKERKVGRQQRERFQAAVKAGAKIAFGTDAGVYPHGQNARQLAIMVEWGMTPLQAIQAATIGNAELFGKSDQVGKIEVGKLADLIAVNGNPLENIRELESVDFVMKDGEVFKNNLYRPR